MRKESLKDLQIPPHLNEQETLETIDRVVKTLSSSFTFGFFDLDDIYQEARIICLKVLPKYDPSKRLDNFLYIHLKRRLLTFWRDNYQRNDPPCPACHVAFRNSSDSPHSDGEYCKKYLAWHQRNLQRKRLMVPVDISIIADDSEKSTLFFDKIAENEEFKELMEKIDLNLPVELRSAFLRLRAGEQVPKTIRERLQEVISEILCQKPKEAS